MDIQSRILENLHERVNGVSIAIVTAGLSWKEAEPVIYAMEGKGLLSVSYMVGGSALALYSLTSRGHDAAAKKVKLVVDNTVNL